MLQPNRRTEVMGDTVSVTNLIDNIPKDGCVQYFCPMSFALLMLYQWLQWPFRCG